MAAPHPPTAAACCLPLLPSPPTQMAFRGLPRDTGLSVAGLSPACDGRFVDLLRVRGVLAALLGAASGVAAGFAVGLEGVACPCASQGRRCGSLRCACVRACVCVCVCV